MKKLLRLALLPLTAAAVFASGPAFKERLGLQLWSLREQMKQNELAALDLAKITGLKYVETAGTGRLGAEKFVEELKKRDLNPVSGHWGYQALKKDVNAVIKDAKALGVTYVICPMLPYQEGSTFTVADAKRYAAEFNEWGAALKAAGLKFGYHPHGAEFAKIEGGELAFDVIMRETKPELVTYEMDVFWVAHAGVDPEKLLRKYPNRWTMLHVKDLRKGAATGEPTPHRPATDNVPVGEGQIDWPGVLRAAQDIGVEYYFIEDETTDALSCIPRSLRYLNGLNL